MCVQNVWKAHDVATITSKLINFSVAFAYRFVHFDLFMRFAPDATLSHTTNRKFNVLENFRKNFIFRFGWNANSFIITEWLHIFRYIMSTGKWTIWSQNINNSLINKSANMEMTNIASNCCWIQFIGHDIVRRLQNELSTSAFCIYLIRLESVMECCRPILWPIFSLRRGAITFFVFVWNGFLAIECIRPFWDGVERENKNGAKCI